MSQEELIVLFKNQVVLKKKLDARIAELTTANVRLCQTEEVLKNLFNTNKTFFSLQEIRNKLEDEQSETKKLRQELEQNKMNEGKLQHELNVS